MPVIEISLLHNINDVLAKINNLKAMISQRSNQLEFQRDKNSKDRISFKQIQSEIQIQNRILEEFNSQQVTFQSQEAFLRQEIAKKVESAINSFLTTQNVKDLIGAIKSQNIDQYSHIESDPEFAASLELVDTKPAAKGVLRVVTVNKTYVLDPEKLKDSLRQELMIRSISI